MHNIEIDDLAEKFGGRFRLTVLIQKRLKELVKGSPKLVEMEDRNLIKIVIEEIRQGKVAFENFTLDDDGKEEGKKARAKMD